MPIDPAQRHQIERDAITAAWEAERLTACDVAIALLREIADLETVDDGEVILGADANVMPRFVVIITRAVTESTATTVDMGNQS